MDATMSAGKSLTRLCLAFAHAFTDALRIRARNPSRSAERRTHESARKDRAQGRPDRFVSGFYGDARNPDLTARRETFELYKLLSGHDNPA